MSFAGVGDLSFDEEGFFGHTRAIERLSLMIAEMGFHGGDGNQSGDVFNNYATSPGNGQYRLPLSNTPSASGGGTVHYLGTLDLPIFGGSNSVAGNAAGVGAVDWQQVRAGSTQVASGAYATIIGGTNCTASGDYSIAGGQATASGTSSVALNGIATANRAVSISSLTCAAIDSVALVNFSHSVPSLLSKAFATLNNTGFAISGAGTGDNLLYTMLRANSSIAGTLSTSHLFNSQFTIGNAADAFSKINLFNSGLTSSTNGATVSAILAANGTIQISPSAAGLTLSDFVAIKSRLVFNGGSNASNVIAMGGDGTNSIVGNVSNALVFGQPALTNYTVPSANCVYLGYGSTSGYSPSGTTTTMVFGEMCVSDKFGCNGLTPQARLASGGAVVAAAGANGYATGAQATAVVTLLNNIRTALVANGIMS